MCSLRCEAASVPIHFESAIDERPDTFGPDIGKGGIERLLVAFKLTVPDRGVVPVVAHFQGPAGIR